MDEIIIENLKLSGRHGCFAFERDRPGDFEVSMRLFLPLDAAAKTDELSDTVDYPSAMAIAEGVLKGESVRLIEKLADMIAERLFVRFERLVEAEVEVAKLGVDVGYDFKKISARIRRKRGGLHKMKASKVVLALGSNMGNRRENIVKAVSMLEEFCAFEAKSRIYETSPVGYAEQRDFLNATVFGETFAEPLELLRQCKRLESALGREANFRNGPRPIDIDIIFYENESVSTEELTVPHPRWRERDFVTTPLVDLLEQGAFDGGAFAELKREIGAFSKMFEPFSAF